MAGGAGPVHVTGETLLEQAAELGIEFPLLATDPGPPLEIARPTVLPTTLILSPEGELATRLLGPQTVESIESELLVAIAAARPEEQR